MKSLLLVILSLASTLADAQRRPLRDLRGRGGDQPSLCREVTQKCVLVRYSVEGMQGKRVLLAQPLCAAVGRNLGGEDPLLLNASACSPGIRTRFTRIPPPNFGERLRPSGLNVTLHQLMNGDRSWPSNVCWEVDVNGGYDFAQLIENESICAAAPRGRTPARINDSPRGMPNDRDGGEREPLRQNRGINY